jgi:dTDP-4-amino-4,6-dideoxygalactose transaminase
MRYPILIPSLPLAQTILPYIERIDANRWYSNFGPLVLEFEEELKNLWPSQKVFLTTTSSGTTALLAALLALDISDRNYCLMPSWTFTATPSAAISAGFTPLFCDIDSQSGMLTPEIAFDVLGKTPHKISAVIVVSAFGAPVPLQPWDSFFSETGIPVIIDAAAGIDAQPIGPIPVAFSLHATKCLGIAEGGLLVSTNESMIQKARKIITFGMNQERQSDFIGINGKLCEYLAAVGLAALKEWPQKRQQFYELAHFYHQKLTLPLKLQPGFGKTWIGSMLNVIFPSVIPPQNQHFLAQHGIETRFWWREGCHQHPAYKKLPKTLLPKTTFLSQRVLGVPFYLGLKEEDIDIICRSLEKCFQKAAVA